MIARQSTARTVTVGPVLDADGVAVTDGVVADFKLSKNGGAPAALNGSATLTHRHTGFYSLALTASDLDTVGSAEVVIDDTTNACPMKVITVIEEAVYDALFAASATGALPVSAGGIVAASFGAGAIDAAAIATGAIDADAIADNAIDAGALAADCITAAKIADGAIDAATFAAGAINAAAIAADAITAAKVADGAIDAATFAAGAIDAAALAADAGTEIGTAVWATATRTLTAGTNIVLAKGTGVTGFNDLSAAQVNAEVDSAIETYHLDHLLAAEYDPASKPGTATALLNELVESDAGVSRFTANALEQGPSGGGGVADWTADERTAIRAILGVPASGTTPDDPTAGILDTIRDSVGTRASQASVDTIDGIVDSILADTGTDGVVISAATASAIADALLDRAAGVETNRTPRQALRLILAALVGKLSGAATTTVTVRDTNDGKDRIVATVDADGNRSAVTLDAS